VKMLEEGQLLGNEDVSLDGDTWHGIGSEPTFSGVIARLMEAPSRSATAAQLPTVDDKPKGPSMERLKQLYEGAWAAVAVVQSKEPFSLRKHLPKLVAGAGAVAGGGRGVGVGLGTPYGYFGLKLLFPSKMKVDSREYSYILQARKGFLADNYQSYRSAKDSAALALKVKEYPRRGRCGARRSST